MKKIFKMSLFMPPISPLREKATGKKLKNATLTPFRTVSMEKVYSLITSNQRLAELTLPIRNAAHLGTAFHLAERCDVNVQYEQLPPESPKSSKVQKFTPSLAHTRVRGRRGVGTYPNGMR